MPVGLSLSGITIIISSRYRYNSRSLFSVFEMKFSVSVRLVYRYRVYIEIKIFREF